jgi:hypothetical protein
MNVPATRKRGDDGGWAAVRWAFTDWLVCWVVVILWAYGPQNFLWLCNLSKFLLLYALWRRDRLVVSSQAGTVCLIGGIWVLDFVPGLATGGATAVVTSYMFDPELPLLARLTSLYHLFLPLMAIWILLRLGYDGRGPWVQTGIGAVVMVATWLLTDPERNVNWLTRPFGVEQVWLPDAIWVFLAVLLYPLLVYWPGHYLVLGILRLAGGRGGGGGGAGGRRRLT